MNDFPPSCWVVLKDMIDASNFRKYIAAYYWSFQTIATVGYGDISAHNQVEHTIAVCWMIFGVGFYSYTIGNMT
jgi:hypothetical protein